jgi:hypothetical protein
MRRLLPGDRMAARVPFLTLSVICVLVAMLLYGLGHGVAALTPLIAAFILVAAAKRA